jgi:hypothetical protein
MAAMDEVLGLLALAGYILAIVGLAAAVTYVVIRIFPTERNPKKDGDAPDKPAKGDAASSGDTPAGSLFRRSKRDKG